MGYMRHHVIIVTGWQDEAVNSAHAKASEIFGRAASVGSGHIAPVTEVASASVNDQHSFMVAPDGSKEGWSHSDAGDAARAEFLAWVKAQRANGLWLEAVELAMPEDAPPAITFDSNAAELETPDYG